MQIVSACSFKISGNRTTDLTNMKLAEVREAEERIVNGDRYKMISVKEHKNTNKSGEPAMVQLHEIFLIP